MSTTYSKSRGAEGSILQLNLINQFYSGFKSMIQRHQAPASICGYISCAYVVILARLLPAGPSTDITDEGLSLDMIAEQALRDYDSVAVEVRREQRDVCDSSIQLHIQLHTPPMSCLHKLGRKGHVVHS